MEPSADYRLADRLLNGRLADTLESLRSGGRSWHSVARQLWVDTNGAVDITGVSAQKWLLTYAGRPDPQAGEQPQAVGQ